MKIKNNEINKVFPMNLQLFGNADPVPQVTTSTDPPKDTTVDPPVDPAEPSKTYTQEELDKLLQQETDKRVTGALKTAQEKWEADYKAKLEAEKKEADRLAKLSAAEKQKELLEKQQSELSKKEQEITLREMKLESVKILSEKGLPISFVDLLTTGDADTTKSNIDTFEKAFKDSLEVAVNERLKSSGIKPQAGVTAADLNAKLEEAKKKAIASGRHEDRVAYAQIKHEIELSKK